MKIKYIDNSKYKANWNKLFHFVITKDYCGLHILFGILNKFIFIVI